MFLSQQWGQSGLFFADRTTLLLRMEGSNGGASFEDKSGLHRALHVNEGVTTSTGQAKVGSASGSFTIGTTNSNGSRLAWKEDLECVMPDDFTIQFWFRLKTTTPAPVTTPDEGYLRRLLSLGDAGIYANSLWIYFDGRTSGSGPRLFFLGTDANGLYTTTIPATSQWHHLAMCRYRVASTQKITVEGWVNGTSIGTRDEDSSAAIYTTLTGLKCLAVNDGQLTADDYGVTTVGATTRAVDVPEYAGDCYIDELQIINGTALYREGVSFTPPDYPL